jgi:hypothetical protein
MNTLSLLQQLFDIERSIGVETSDALRIRVQNVENSVIQMQKELAENLRKESGRGTSRRSEFAAQ